MVYAVHFAGAVLACYLIAQVLTRSTWTYNSPRVAIVCWQAVGLALGLAAIGLPLSAGLEPYHDGVGNALFRLASGELAPGFGPPHVALVLAGFGVGGVLIGTTITCGLRAIRAQRRHRDLLTLVARDDPAAPGALVLDHPSAAAYCLPGVRPTVVVSAGTLSLLDRAQLAAVLSHERAHADERHDLVLLPFTALCRALPWAGWVRAARDTVALLVEMRADDRARRHHMDGALAAALLRFASAPSRVTPAGALGVAGTTPESPAGLVARPVRPLPITLGIADNHLDARVRRLLTTGRPPRVRGAIALGVTATLVVTTVALFVG
ncbi:M56 family metallopeptidase [Phytohabitans kaempferiae]|uniref:M56 family metallopeptidase n=1 Tax=Phytohabitans kaempferiae TaxID=1620943 RepID=A0ABV6M0B8_9ACTN